MPGQRIKLSLHPEELAALRAYCAEHERTPAWVISKLLRDAGITAAPGGKASSQKMPGAALSDGGDA